jgi:hypothetical protein
VSDFTIITIILAIIIHLSNTCPYVVEIWGCPWLSGLLRPMTSILLLLTAVGSSRTSIFEFFMWGSYPASLQKVSGSTQASVCTLLSETGAECKNTNFMNDFEIVLWVRTELNRILNNNLMSVIKSTWKFLFLWLSITVTAYLNQVS